MLKLDDLSVGEVSGMIAAATFVVQIFIPLALPLILIGMLRERNSSITTSAASWSVIGRFLHNSSWPVILSTDSAATKAVSLTVSGISWLGAFAGVLIGMAAIVTPLGLYESVFPANNPTPEKFHYIPDKSPMGDETMSRANTPWSRICGGFIYVACPNSRQNVTTIKNETGIYTSGDWYDSHVQPNIVDLFQSGLSTMEKSVSSVFDIQWRIYTWSSVDSSDPIPIDNGTTYPVSAFRQMESALLEDSIKIVEGLIVDMKNGGVGFRNHSAPPLNEYGSTWSEDILFIEPETHCVDTNLTLDYTVPQTSNGSILDSSISNLVLTDRGGFVNIIQDYPMFDRNDTQNNPQFWQRAYKAAWLNNVWSMVFMNVTNPRNETDPGSKPFEFLNSAINKTFPLQDKNSSSLTIEVNPGALSIRSSFGDYIEGLDMMSSNTSFPGLNSTSSSTSSLWENPFDVSKKEFSDIAMLCQGAGGADNANISNFISACGLIYGAPRREGAGTSLIMDPGSNWTVPMYSCISATKAVIKTVTFRFNGSRDDISSLTVTSLADKTYKDNSSKPLWGVEGTNLSLADVNPLWGLLDAKKIGNVNMSTLQKESLWLPGYGGGFGSMSTIGHQNLPGVEFYGKALAAAYDIGGSLASVADYSGSTSLPMFRLWQNLSQSVNTASKIPNLIWTDIAMNAVVGTKSLAPATGTNNGSGGGTTTKRKRDGEKTPSRSDDVRVTKYHRQVKYKLRFGIPAFIALFFTICIAVFAFFLFVFGCASPSKMRKYLNETSAGRRLTSGSGIENSRGAMDLPESRKAWVDWVGRREFTLGGDRTRTIRDSGISKDGDQIRLVSG